MRDILVLRDLDQIKAISHPYRIEILEAFEEAPSTAKQIADKLGEPHAKVNYHIKTLLKVGIIELFEEKVKLGIVEKYYLPMARMFMIDRNILNCGEKNIIESLNQASISIFENISKDFYRAVEIADEKEHPKKILHYNDYYLTKEEVLEFQDNLKEFMQDFLKDKKNKDRKNTKKYSISSLVIPRVRGKK